MEIPPFDPRFKLGPAIDERAFHLQANYIADRTCAVWQAPASGGLWIGSATPVRLGDRLLLATAGHNLDRIQSLDELEIIPPLSDARRLRAVRAERSQDGGRDFPDVAWLEIPREAEGVGRLTSIGLEEMRLDVRHRPESPVWCQGYPSSEVRLESNGRDLLSLGGITGTHEARPSEPGGSEADTLLVEYPPHDWPGSTPLPDGISGGGIWRIPRYLEEPIWSPNGARLVAISRQWHKRDKELHATPIRRWLEFVAQQLPVFQEEIGRAIAGSSLPSA